MAGPYLKSGESIVLTTDRVLIDDIEYDLILTSQRLALVDSGHTVDQPKVVPFATIISVKGGTTPAREPVITLTVTDPAGLADTKALDLIFSQQPYQDRSAECDLWVKKLIEHIVSVRQEPAEAEKQPAAEKTQGMHPTVRRFIAPDVPLPHTEVLQNRRPSEELLSAMQGAAWESRNEAPEKPGIAERAFPGPRSSEPEEDTLVIAPLPEGEEAAPEPAHEDMAPGTPDKEDTGTVVTATMPQGETDLNSESTVPKEGAMQNAVPVTPFRELVSTDDDEVQDTQAPVHPEAHPVAGPSENIEELSRQIEEVEPVLPEEPDASRPTLSAPTGIPGNVVFPVLSKSAPGAGPEPASPAIPQTEKEAAGQFPVPQPRKKRAVIAGTIALALVILVLIGVAAVITLPSILEHENGGGIPTLTTTVTPLPVTTTTPAGEIAPQGVWVKVTYNGTFIGSYGNPGPTNQNEVRGTGQQVYSIRNSNDLVQVSFQKQDYSGNTLTVEVYNNGTMVTQVSKNSPKAEISLLVDPKTGKAPQVSVTTLGG